MSRVVDGPHHQLSKGVDSGVREPGPFHQGYRFRTRVFAFRVGDADTPTGPDSRWVGPAEVGRLPLVDEDLRPVLLALVARKTR